MSSASQASNAAEVLDLPRTSTRADSPPGIFGASLIVLRKDILIEWRTKARLNALLFFAVATLLMFSFALGPDTKLLKLSSGAYLWLSLLLSSTLALGESFRVERENGALDGLRLTPADARAIFVGKALGNSLLLFGMSAVLIPIMAAMFGVEFQLGYGKLLLVMLLGTMAIAAPGTVQAAIASNARARDVLLPLLLFPLLIPALMASVKGTTLVMQGDPMGQLDSWVGLLGGFNLIYWGLGFALFPKVIEG